MAILNDIKIYFRMLFNYKPKTFWNDLLSNSFDLKGVGHYRLSNEENLKMYEKKKSILEEQMQHLGIEISTQTKILEIGAGVGYWTEFLKSKGAADYTGNDIAEISVNRLKEKYPEYNFIHGDISEINLPKNNYDLAIMIDVTQHITDDDKFSSAMEKLWESLKQNSYLIITMWDPNKNVYLANKLRLNRIEKPRGLESYNSVFKNTILLCNVDFNDKNLLIFRKP
jgi:2-polyprenyl-3-methyl-5-hydroxy-6-metoxy-1,4-benzoquinol methylase